MAILKIFQTIEDIPPSHIDAKESIYGRVAEVLDADTLRIRHVNGLFGLAARKAWKHSRGDRDIGQETLKIRIYGVRAPTDPQGGDRARLFTQEFFQTHTMVKVTFLKRLDDYVVGRVETEDQLQSFGVSGAMPRDFTLELARAGYAQIAKGGVFHGRRGLIDKTIEVAKKKKQGMWGDHGGDPLIDRTIDIVPHNKPQLWGNEEEDPLLKQRRIASKQIAARALAKVALPASS